MSAATTTTDWQARSPVRPVGRRRSRTATVGVLLAILGALTAWFAYTQATSSEEVVATARHVAYGTTIGEDDLRPVEIPVGSTLRTIAWAEHATVIGRVATTDLAPDVLLSPDSAEAARLPGRGAAIVGLPVGPGRLPVSGLAPRDVVEVVLPAAPGPGVRATVLAVGDADASGRRTVDLIVPETAVDDVAVAAANDNTLLVLVGSG